MKSIGVFLATPRAGGGSYQWMVNILSGLDDYQRARDDISIRAFHYRQYGEIDELKTSFPGFSFYQIGEKSRFLMRVFRRIANAAPRLIPALRAVFPLNFILAKCRVDLMLFPVTVLDSSLCNRKHVFFLADIAHVFYPHFPEVSAGGELRRRDILFNYGLANADQIVVESEQLRQDIAKYYRADVDKTAVIYQAVPKAFGAPVDLAASKEDEAGFSRGLPREYIFYPAQLWEHKNHKNLLYALKLVREEMPDLELVLTGSRKEGDERLFALIEELGVKDQVKYLGYVEDRFMPLLYKQARALVMPTYFGPSNIPTLEAFYYGCPAVISGLPGVEEQTGDAALFFDPDSPEDMAGKIMSVLRDESLRKQMVEKGYERLRRLSYENYRESFFAVLDKNLAASETAR